MDGGLGGGGGKGRARKIAAAIIVLSFFRHAVACLHIAYFM